MSYYTILFNRLATKYTYIQVPVYIAEITPKRFRGGFSYANQVETNLLSNNLYIKIHNI